MESRLWWWIGRAPRSLLDIRKLFSICHSWWQAPSTYSVVGASRLVTWGIVSYELLAGPRASPRKR